MTLSLEEAKAHLKVEHTDEDALILGWIYAATRNAEAVTGTRIIQKQITKKFPAFSSEMQLEWPLISVDQIKYVDNLGVEKTLYDTISTPNITSSVFQVVRKWQAELSLGKPYITTGFEQSWPDSRIQPEAVSITYTAGYSRNFIPNDIRAAIMLLVGHLYANRETTIKGTIITDLPFGYLELLQSHKIYSL